MDTQDLVVGQEHPATQEHQVSVDTPASAVGQALQAAVATQDSVVHLVCLAGRAQAE